VIIVVTIALLAVVLVIIFAPAINRVQASKAEILRLFLDLPRSTLKELHFVSLDRVKTMMASEDDSDMANADLILQQLGGHSGGGGFGRQHKSRKEQSSEATAIGTGGADDSGVGTSQLGVLASSHLFVYHTCDFLQTLTVIPWLRRTAPGVASANLKWRCRSRWSSIRMMVLIDQHIRPYASSSCVTIMCDHSVGLQSPLLQIATRVKRKPRLSGAIS